MYWVILRHSSITLVIQLFFPVVILVLAHFSVAGQWRNYFEVEIRIYQLLSIIHYVHRDSCQPSTVSKQTLFRSYM